MRIEEIHEVLGLSREEFGRLKARFTKEFMEIMHAETHTKVADGLVRWFSEGDENEKMVKGVVVSQMFHMYQGAVISLLPPDVAELIRMQGQVILFMASRKHES